MVHQPDVYSGMVGAAGRTCHEGLAQVEMEVEEEEEGSDVEGCWYCRLVDGSEGGPFTLRQLRLALAQ